MDRVWLLTWTMYGNWLPGDDRGSVSSIKEGDSTRHRHNQVGMPYDGSIPELRHSAQTLMQGDPVRLNQEQAQAVLEQFHETATIRGWSLLAVAVMVNHVHLVVGVPDDPDPANLLKDFKSYASRALNMRYSTPINGTWWTESGSRRKLSDDDARQKAVAYVLNQGFPLVVWAKEVGEKL